MNQPRVRDIFRETHPDVRYGMGAWWEYAHGIWHKTPENAIKKRIMAYAESAGLEPTAQLVNSVTEMVKWAVNVPDELWDHDDSVVICRNGVLDVAERKLVDHAPAYYATAAVPYAYDPQADCPAWRQVLATTIPQAAAFLQEFAGYCLTTDTSYETALWLYGPPGGGKSTVIHGISTMLGPGKVGALSLADVARSRFGLASIPGKTLVVATEQPAGYMQVSHILNAIISGEPVLIEQKYRDPLRIIPRAKILWAMNTLPRIPNAEDGLFRRVKVLEFPAIAEARRDPTLKDRITHEGAGILNWALEGLSRLRDRGRFQVPGLVSEATEYFRHTNDIPSVFIEERCLLGPDKLVKASDLYAAYRSWCDTTGHKPQSSTSLAEDWKRLGFRKTRKSDAVYWLGLGLQTT